MQSPNLFSAMNFVNRHIGDPGNDAVRIGPGPSTPVARKWPVRYESIELLALCTDIATILFAGFLSALLYKVQHGESESALSATLGAAIVASALLVSVLKANGLYRPTELLVLRSQIHAIGMVWTSLVVLACALAAIKVYPEFSRGAGSLFALLCLALLIAQRAIVRAFLTKCLSDRKFARINILLISDQPPSRYAGLSESLGVLGFCVKGRFNLPSVGSSAACRKRLSAQVIQHIRTSEIDEIVLEATPDRWSDLRAFIADLRVLPLPIMFVPIGATSDLLRHPTRHLGSTICVELQRGPLTPIECASKRAIDLIGAGLALIILMPWLALAALAIKLDSPGPVLFRQQRCGFNGRIFLIRKFRTMRVLEDGPVVIQATPDDRRVTRIGRWLRRTSFDELPQLLNVLDGSMSLVGPRPHAMAHDGEFDRLVRNYASRRRVKPGLTGWAQVHGCRGPTPTPSAIERRVDYDLWYIDNWSVRLDLAILMQTPIEVLRGRNAC